MTDKKTMEWHDVLNNSPMGPPMADIEAGLFKAYAKQLFIREVTVFKYRQTRMNTKIQRYFNSTPTKNVLARILCLATYVNQPYTKTEIADQIGVSRQAVHDLIEECVAEGWAEVSDKHYKASPVLVEAGENYVEFNFNTVKDSGVVDAFAALASFQKLRQAS